MVSCINLTVYICQGFSEAQIKTNCNGLIGIMFM